LLVKESSQAVLGLLDCRSYSERFRLGSVEKYTTESVAGSFPET